MTSWRSDGLHHGWDPNLMRKGMSEPEAKTYAIMLSQNIMVSWASLCDLRLPKLLSRELPL